MGLAALIRFGGIRRPGGMLDPLLYAALGVVDVLLMAHAARREFPPASTADEEEAPCSASPLRPAVDSAGPAESSHRDDAGQASATYLSNQDGPGT